MRTTKDALIDCLAVVSLIAACGIIVMAYIHYKQDGLEWANVSSSMAGFLLLFPGYARLTSG